MEQNTIGATLDTVEHGMNSELWFNSSVDDTIENLLSFEPSDFDFDISDFSDLPITSPLPPPLPPATTEIPVGENSMHIQNELQLLLSLSSDSDQPNVIGLHDNREIVSKQRHKLSISANGSSMASSCVMKRAFTVEQLAEIAKTNPKKAKRIVANRKAAARSKERRTHQTTELEGEVQSLQMVADNLNKEFEMVENKNEDLRTSNNLVKVHIQSMTDESKKLDAFLESLKEQQRILKIQIDQNSALMGNCLSVGELVSQFSSQLAPQNTQPQFQAAPPQHPQLCMPPPPPPPPRFGEPLREHFIGSDFSNCNPLN